MAYLQRLHIWMKAINMCPNEVHDLRDMDMLARHPQPINGCSLSRIYEVEPITSRGISSLSMNGV